MWPLDQTAPGPDALYSSCHFLAESELKLEKCSLERFHDLFAFVLLFGVFHVTIERENFELAPGRWFLFDGFHSFMAPQITLFLEFLYGFLCAPIVLIFGIQNVEYMVFLTDKNVLFIVWMYIQNCTSNILIVIFDWCRGPDTHSRHYKCWFQAVSSHVRLREYHTFISLRNSHARYICSFLLSKLTTKDETYGK